MQKIAPCRKYWMNLWLLNQKNFSKSAVSPHECTEKWVSIDASSRRFSARIWWMIWLVAKRHAERTACRCSSRSPAI